MLRSHCDAAAVAAAVAAAAFAAVFPFCCTPKWVHNGSNTIFIYLI